jgi:uncharacterized protein YoxC
VPEWVKQFSVDNAISEIKKNDVLRSLVDTHIKQGFNLLIKIGALQRDLMIQNATIEAVNKDIAKQREAVLELKRSSEVAKQELIATQTAIKAFKKKENVEALSVINKILDGKRACKESCVRNVDWV